jgi:hypothetical protein
MIAKLLQMGQSAMKINVVFEKKKSGFVEVKYGTLRSPREFAGTDRIEVSIADESAKAGAFTTIIHVISEQSPFSFNLRDVSSAYPIYIPEFGAAALPEKDRRTYREVADDIASRHLLSDFTRMNSEPEESYENACKFNRDRNSPIWLGVGRDVRGFWVEIQDVRSNGPQLSDYRQWGVIRPSTHVHGSLPDKNATKPFFIQFDIGPGPHCRPTITRCLDEGCLPILHSVQDEQSIQYHLTSFATLERHTLSESSVQGTDPKHAYSFCGYPGECRLPREEIDSLRRELPRDEEVVSLTRIRACNVGKTPAYAFFRAGYPLERNWSPDVLNSQRLNYEFKNGACELADYANKTAVISLLDGKPMPEPEMSVLVMPGECATMDLIVPNAPVPPNRAIALAKINYEEHLKCCRNFWREKLAGAAKIQVPEKMIGERFKAGLLHLDLATTGEQKGALLANVGIRYSPIGSESAPIIQFYDSMGLHEMAERCIQFFLDRQNPDGSITTYHTYENETGPLLWTAGEHFRYSRDLEWLKRVTPKLIKACDYLLAWREKNKTEECRKAGCYGLTSGQVDDPVEHFHSFYLNAGSYAGLIRMAEVLLHTKPAYAKKIVTEAEAYRLDIIDAMHRSRAKSPVMPVADGTWVPHLPPWTEYTGDPAYHADGGEWMDHGTILYRTLVNSALYCGIFEVLDCDSDDIAMMLKTNQHPHTRENGAHCQPYYLRHDFAHLKRGEVKLFLKIFYNQMSAMQDRETYSTWEHYYSVPHKTHEEAWILMQIRWMLYLEDGDSLELFKAVPRKWLKPGKHIVIDGMKSKFGALRAKVEAGDNEIRCEFESEFEVCETRIRLPHHQNLRAVSCEGGEYDSATETVSVKGRQGKVKLIF